MLGVGAGLLLYLRGLLRKWHTGCLSGKGSPHDDVGILASMPVSVVAGRWGLWLGADWPGRKLSFFLDRLGFVGLYLELVRAVSLLVLA